MTHAGFLYIQISILVRIRIIFLWFFLENITFTFISVMHVPFKHAQLDRG